MYVYLGYRQSHPAHPFLTVRDIRPYLITYKNTDRYRERVQCQIMHTEKKIEVEYRGNMQNILNLQVRWGKMLQKCPEFVV
jgi:hypothetical protein